MANNQIDDKIREALTYDDEAIQVPLDLYTRINSGVLAGNEKDTPEFKATFSGLNSRHKLLLSLGCFLALFIVSGICFKDVRVMAEDVINTLKTIFVLEKNGDDYTLVEKPAEQVNFTPGVSRSTQLTDTELSQKLGYKVCFPDVLNYHFFINHKALGVSLQKQMNYIQEQQLLNSMLKAIEDDSEFEKLKEYDPYRSVFAAYKNSQGVTVFINIWKTSPDKNEKYSESKENKTVSIGNIQGKWSEFHMANYPFISVNGMGTSDLSKKPKVEIRHSLSWEANGLNYHLCFFEYYNELSLEQSIKVAASFMEQQNLKTSN